ncbi:MAG: DUF3866 family protein [Tepidibacillus sp.]|uniref:DUF3866 family protein n=1 Tax=Tepidibacillus sp. HK-1 TaxID=1883407 RepID=UPI000852E61E|nr:DUF3866 family protein [Tepidibacillus sp. HK-1]GBF12541.1 hypothetical protein HK1_02607 [Tepidibacillus sp. HK-1]
MVFWGKGKVIQILEETGQSQVLKVQYSDGEGVAIHYLEFFPALQIGDQIWVNRTATFLQLGTGGYDYVLSILNHNENGVVKQTNGHIMKLRYTPLQFSVLSCEEQGSEYHHIFTKPRMLQGLPVMIGELHSMLPIVVTILRQLEKKGQKRLNIVYIMTDGAALPLAFSKHVLQLKKLGWLDHTITIGQAFGGDLEAINIYTALIAAKYIYNADVVLVMMGPGIVGTGSWLGHTGVEQGSIINAVSSLEGVPITIVRASSNDQRGRHVGISHHTLSTLKYISLTRSIVPFPSYLKETFPNVYSRLSEHAIPKHQLEPVSISHSDVKEIIKTYPFPIVTMGRTIEQEPLFFDFIASAAYWFYQHF